ncbi:hypothetical protein IWZ01DRAFT_4018 [Phyllosticta capitalensis]
MWCRARPSMLHLMSWLPKRDHSKSGQLFQKSKSSKSQDCSVVMLGNVCWEVDLVEGIIPKTKCRDTHVVLIPGLTWPTRTSDYKPQHGPKLRSVMERPPGSDGPIPTRTWHAWSARTARRPLPSIHLGTTPRNLTRTSSVVAVVPQYHVCALCARKVPLALYLAQGPFSCGPVQEKFPLLQAWLLWREKAPGNMTTGGKHPPRNWTDRWRCSLQVALCAGMIIPSVSVKLAKAI